MASLRIFLSPKETCLWKAPPSWYTCKRFRRYWSRRAGLVCEMTLDIGPHKIVSADVDDRNSLETLIGRHVRRSAPLDKLPGRQKMLASLLVCDATECKIITHNQ